MTSIHSAMIGVLSDLSEMGIGKDRQARGGGGTYNFRGIDDIYNVCSPLFAKHRIYVVPRVVDHSITERPRDGGKVTTIAIITAEFDFVAEDGSKVTARTVGEAIDVSDKATNKAMSVAMKYACFQAFCIPLSGVDTEVDDHPKPSAVDRVRSRFQKGGDKPWDLDMVIEGINACKTIEALEKMADRAMMLPADVRSKARAVYGEKLAALKEAS